MQRRKKPLDRVRRVRHMVAMIARPSKAASLPVLEHVTRNPDRVAKR